MSEKQSIVINGWNLFTRPLFNAQWEELLVQFEKIRQKYPKSYLKKNATKHLLALTKMAFEVIPQDPTHEKYCQGDTLGDDYKHWFRAKFLQQYRLFFRYHLESKTIILAWVNDEKSKRAYESSTDAYRVFRKMLESGYPPDDWDDLLKEAKSETNRLERMIANTEILAELKRSLTSS